MLKVKVRQVLDAIKRLEEKNGESAPEPLATKKYSGKFMVRVPPETHRRLVVEAAEAGVSLNRLVASRLH